MFDRSHLSDADISLKKQQIQVEKKKARARFELVCVLELLITGESYDSDWALVQQPPKQIPTQ